MKNAKLFKKSMRLKVLKIFEFKIKTIICKKTEISAATILKNWQLQRSDKKQGERKKKRKKIHLLILFTFYTISKKKQRKFSLQMIN